MQRPGGPAGLYRTREVRGCAGVVKLKAYHAFCSVLTAPHKLTLLADLHLHYHPFRHAAVSTVRVDELHVHPSLCYSSSPARAPGGCAEGVAEAGQRRSEPPAAGWQKAGDSEGSRQGAGPWPQESSPDRVSRIICSFLRSCAVFLEMTLGSYLTPT